MVSRWDRNPAEWPPPNMTPGVQRGHPFHQELNRAAAKQARRVSRFDWWCKPYEGMNPARWALLGTFLAALLVAVMVTLWTGRSPW